LTVIDIAKNRYQLVALRPDGGRIKLLSFLQSLTWEESEGELAVRLTAEIKNVKMGDGKWLHQQTPLGGRVILYSDWGSGWQEVFRGTVFAWDYHADPLGHCTITAYDRLIYLMKSKDDRYYKAGQTGKAIIQDIAKAWNIPFGTMQGPNAALAKQVFRGDALADMISGVLEQSRKRGDGKWIVRGRGNKIDVIRPGRNKPVYCFEKTVESIEDRQDIEDLVTRVKIVGAEDDEGRAPVVARLDGRTELGVLQDVVYQRSYDTAAAAKTAAEEVLKERGRPQRKRRVIGPDLPFLRKGDKVKVKAGTLNGYYIVSGVVHNSVNKIMSMEVEDVE